jgi:large repetitive protein
MIDMKSGPLTAPNRFVLVALSTILVAAACDDDPTAPPSVDPITIGTTSLDQAIEGQTYSQQLAATGGSGGYSWLVTAGSLPTGLTLSPTGTISGTPIAPGTANFRVRASDSGGRSATADLSIPVVQTLAVHTWALPDASVGESYLAPIQPVGGLGTLTWNVSGEAASWLTISPAGVLSGTPTTGGASTVTITVSDESGQQATRQLPIVVRAPLAIADVSLSAATEGRAYAAQLVATGGDGDYSWTIDRGALPTGMALTPGGALMGTPENAGEFEFTAQVTDGGERVATRTLMLTVERAPTIHTTSLPVGDVGEPYAAQLLATGGTGAYSWSVIEGALPVGLTLSSAGAISGTPSLLGSFAFTARVIDAAGATHTRAFTLVVADVVELVSGVAVTGIAGDSASIRYFAIQVPAGSTELRVSISGGSGDADLYVRRGALPQQFVYDCRPFRPGSAETCTFTAPVAGTWYIMIRGYDDYAGLSLVATVDQ